MTSAVRFALVPADRLRAHESVEPDKVEELVKELRSTGRVREPILVARGSNVILNGHHRFAALRAMGIRRIPAWVVEYEGSAVEVDRWSPGPKVSKADVIAHALNGTPFPPKTTRHRVTVPLPPRPILISDLIDGRATAVRNGARVLSAPTRAARAVAPAPLKE